MLSHALGFVNNGDNGTHWVTVSFDKNKKLFTGPPQPQALWRRPYPGASIPNPMRPCTGQAQARMTQ